VLFTVNLVKERLKKNSRKMIKVLFGIISLLLAVIGYSSYFRDLFKEETKPHVFSWLVWSIMTGTAFVAQLLNNAGPGAWVMGLTAVASLFVFLYAFKYGEKNITLSDKLSLSGAIFAILLWYFTNNALIAIILLIIIDALGFYPTFRKSYHKPFEESILLYIISATIFAISLLALENYSPVTYLYPLFLIIINTSFTWMVLLRRSKTFKH
jgi:hypothetical protein